MTDADLILTLRDDVRRLRERHFSILADRMERVANVLEERGAQLERANDDRKAIAAMTFEWKAEVATVVAERDRLLEVIEIVVEKCKRFNPHSDSVDRAFVNSMAIALAEASTTRPPASDWATRALAVEQDRDRLRRIADDWQIKAMNAEQERDRLADEVERLALIVDRWESENRAKKDAALANATGPVGGGA